MRQDGTVATWKGDKGFGFIKPRQPGADVFFNIAEFRSVNGTQPRIGLVVSFDVIHVGGKGPRAMAVRPVGEAERRPPADAAAPSVAHARARGLPARRRTTTGPPSSGAMIALPLMLAYYVLMLAAIWRGGLPVWVLGASVAVNLLTFYIYWQDKYKAGRRAWRISEAALHLWGLAGGWPGAWFAQQILRHKSVKAEFRSSYWVSVVVHCAAFGGLLWFQGVLQPLIALVLPR